MKNQYNSTPVDKQRSSLLDQKQTNKSRFQKSAANILTFQQDDMLGEIENNMKFYTAQDKLPTMEDKKCRRNGFLLDDQAQIEREVIFQKWGEQTSCGIPQHKLENFGIQTPDNIVRERRYNISIQELLSKKPDELLKIESLLEDRTIKPRRNLKQIERVMKSDNQKDTSNLQSDSVSKSKEIQQGELGQRVNNQVTFDIQKISAFSNDLVNNQMRLLLQGSIEKQNLNQRSEIQYKSPQIQREITTPQQNLYKEESIYQAKNAFKIYGKNQTLLENNQIQESIENASKIYGKNQTLLENNQIQYNEQEEGQSTPLVIKYNKYIKDFMSRKIKQSPNQRITQNDFLKKAYYMPSLQYIRLQEQIIEKASTNVSQSMTPLKGCLRQRSIKKKNKNVRFSEQVQILLEGGDIEQRAIVEKYTQEKKQLRFDRDGFQKFWEEST